MVRDVVVPSSVLALTADLNRMAVAIVDHWKEPPIQGVRLMNLMAPDRSVSTIRVLNAMSLALSPNGRRLAVVVPDRKVQVANTRSGPPPLTLTDGPESIHTLTVSPDGSFLAASGWDYRLETPPAMSLGKACIWDTASGTRRWVFKTTGGIFTSSFSPDGKTFAAAGQDGIIRLWSLTDGRLTRTFRIPGPR